MDLSFGARLRSQRERQQVSLTGISEQTKIKLSLLEGLERDDVSHWPGGIFRRGYLRAYANTIGLEPDAVVREFLQLYPDPVDPDAAVVAIAENAGGEPSKKWPPTRLRYLIGSALGSLQSLGAQAGERFLGGDTTPAVNRDAVTSHERLGAHGYQPAPWAASQAVAGETVPRAIAEAMDEPAAMAYQRQPDGDADTDYQANAEADRGSPGPRSVGSQASYGAETALHSARSAGAGRQNLHHVEADPRGARSVEAGRQSLRHADADIQVGPYADDETVVQPLLPGVEPQFSAPLSMTFAHDFPAEQQRSLVDLSAVAQLCTRIARAVGPPELRPVLRDAAGILHAVGVILWMRDPEGNALWPLLSHGYSDEVMAQLPNVHPDTDNAIAGAFRAAETRVVEGSALATGAVVIPLMTPTGCGGVLALELKDGRERCEYVRAFATILAAQLSTLVGGPSMAHATA